MGLQAHRADETYSPGLIIADIVKQISESKIVIAEITEANPNVYYEVGYSHAINKPTILIADKGIKLPFDVSAFRTLFYENSIGGKNKIEKGLREFLRNILAQPANLSRTP
jgi:nucleoside 2-deoxyribosyltransferase